MLDIIRKKKDSPWVKVILVAIAITFFGGFGLLGYCSRQQRAEEAERNKAASVNGAIITIQQVDRIAGRLRMFDTKPLGEAEWTSLREKVLDTLINQELVYQEALRLGMVAGDAEIDQTIAQTFQQNGVFQPEAYLGYLQNQGISEEDYREELRKELTVEKMMRMVGSSAIVTDEDIRQFYLYENEEANLAVIEFDPSAITVASSFSTDELKARYDNNPEGYIIKEKRSIKYSCFFPSSQAVANISEDEIRQYYEANKNSKYAIEPHQVKVRHIIFRLSPSMSDEEREAKKKKAQEVLEEIKKGTATFENIASIYSEDEETKNKGGDAGWVDMSTKSGPVAEAIMKMKPGDISDVIQTGLGLYIIKVEGVKEGKFKPLNAVRKEIVGTLRKERTGKWAKETAETMANAIREGKTFEEAAKTANAEVHVTDLFEQTATEIKGVPDSQKFITSAFQNLYDEGKDADIVTLENGACVIQVVKIIDEHTASFEEAIPQLKVELLAQARKNKAKEIAQAVLNKIKGGTPFEKAVTAPAKYYETGYFARKRGVIPNIGASEEIMTTAFSLPPHRPVAEQVFEASGKFYLIKLLGRKEADPSAFEKERDTIKQKLLAQRQYELAHSWIEALKAKADIQRKSLAPEPQEQESGTL